MNARKRRGTCALAILLAAAAPVPAQDNGPVRIPRPDDPVPVASPDTTGFWFYVRRGERDRARAELERLRGLAPGWEPPAAMRRALTPTAEPAAASQAARADAAHDALLGRIAELSPAAQRALDAATLRRAIAGARMRGRGRELLLLAWVALERDDLALAGALFREAKRFDASLDTAAGLRQVALAQADTALRGGDAARLRVLLEGPAGAAVAGRITAAAWARHDAGAMDKALTLFALVPEAPGADLGRALALRASGRRDAALTLACASDGPELADLCRAWLATRQLAAYDRGDYRNAIADADALARRGGLTADARELRAWSYARLGRDEAAVADFLALLETQPARDDLAAVIVDLLAADPQRLAAIGERRRAVAEARRRRGAGAAFARRQFDLAARLGHPQLGARAGVTVGAGLDWRERDGDPGLNELTTARGWLDLGALSGAWRWRLRATHSSFRQGDVSAGDWFATAPLATAAPGAREDGTGLRLEVSRQAPAFSVYAALARDPWQQRANAGVTGQLSLSRFAERTTAALTVYHRFRRDTALARIGSIDPRVPVTWGGALATGARALVARTLPARWTLSGTGFAEQIDGERLDSNRGLGLRLALTRTHRTLRGEGAYWRSGPYLRRWTYEDNRSAFTLGHGGYFSPERFDSIGLGSELLTAEGRRWQVKLAANVAYSELEQAAYERFPLSGTGPRVAARRASGPSGELTAQFQARLGRRWRLAGFAYYLDAIEFRSTAVGLELRWSSTPRRGVFSDTLPLENPWIKGFAL